MPVTRRCTGERQSVRALEKNSPSGPFVTKVSQSKKYIDMKTDQITIRVDKETAEAYRAASEEERRKIDSLLNLKLRRATRSQVSIKTYMDEISRRAKERGLTPEILESLLNDE